MQRSRITPGGRTRAARVGWRAVAQHEAPHALGDAARHAAHPHGRDARSLKQLKGAERGAHKAPIRRQVMSKGSTRRQSCLTMYGTPPRRKGCSTCAVTTIRMWFPVTTAPTPALHSTVSVWGEHTSSGAARTSVELLDMIGCGRGRGEGVVGALSGGRCGRRRAAVERILRDPRSRLRLHKRVATAQYCTRAASQRNDNSAGVLLETVRYSLGKRLTASSLSDATRAVVEL